MHPADMATRPNAKSKFARRTNAGFADATCNLTTGMTLSLEPAAILAFEPVRGQPCPPFPHHCPERDFSNRFCPVIPVLSGLPEARGADYKDSVTNISSAGAALSWT